MVRLSIQFSIKTNTAERESVACQQKARFENLIICEYWRFVLSSEFLTFNNEIKANVNIADEFHSSNPPFFKGKGDGGRGGGMDFLKISQKGGEGWIQFFLIRGGIEKRGGML